MSLWKLMLFCLCSNFLSCNKKITEHEFKSYNPQNIYNSLSIVDFISIVNTPNLNEATDNFLTTIDTTYKLNLRIRAGMLK